MNKLSSAIDRFCARHPRWGIPNLMRYVVIGTVAVYLLYLVTGFNSQVFSLLSFSPYHILRGQIWRLVTFIFVPSSSSALFLVISLYFYYWIGSTLENQWGTPKFTIYYLSGAILTIIAASLATAITGINMAVASTSYVNLSMFLAFAALFPDAQVLLLFIPVKIKWLAWLDVALFAIEIFQALLARSVVGVLVPIIALLNFVVFFWPYFSQTVERQKYQHSRQASNFRRATHQAQQPRGYNHKCAVCGKTDTDYPNMTFRYCSRCAGYHCFCEDHIFNHVHFTDENS